MSQLSEICVDCGKSVAQGSGRFVNRVPVLDDYEERKGLYNHPEGEFVCAECSLTFEYFLSYVNENPEEAMLISRCHTDLVEACEATVEYLLGDSGNWESGVRCGDKEGSALLDKLETAIAKTEGTP